MKTILLTEETENVQNFYITTDGDVLFKTEITCLDTIAIKVVADNFYPGTIDEWKKSIKSRVENNVIILPIDLEKTLWADDVELELPGKTYSLADMNNGVLATYDTKAEANAAYNEAVEEGYQCNLQNIDETGETEEQALQSAYDFYEIIENN
jgi:hypothetical protein